MVIRGAFMDIRWSNTALILAISAFAILVRVMSARGLLFDNPYLDMFPLLAMSSLVAGYAFQSRYALAIPLSFIVVGDIVLYSLGHAPFFLLKSLWVSLFVLTGFFGITLLGWGVAKISRPHLVWFAGGSVWSVLLYDAWTNFGFFLAFYPQNLAGLTACYFNAIPFTLGHLMGMLLLTIPGFILCVISRKLLHPQGEVKTVIST